MASTAVSPQATPAKGAVGVDVNDKAATPKRKAQPVSYWSLFRFADRIDVALFVVGIIANLGNGIIFPMFSFIFAGLLDSFFDQGSAVAQIDKYAGYLAIIAAGTLVCSFFGLGGILWSAERQGSRLRKAYLRALLRAEVGYHDTNHTAEAVSRMSEDVSVMLKGIGEPFANTIQFGTQFVAGLIMGFVRGPKLAAVVCCFLPLLALCAAGMKVLLGKIQKLEADAYARAGEIATESISNIRSVASNCGEEAEVRRYDRHLSQAERMGRFKGLATGLSMGGIWFSILSCYGVGLWYGSTLIVDSRLSDPGCEIDPLKAGCFTGGSVINVFFAVIIAAFAIAQAAPNLSAFGTACGAAATIYDLIDRVPEIDNLAEGGLKPDPASVRGRVEFRNVTFAYPSRPAATVLRDFSLVIEAGHTVALVGPSGCGKSSVIALLQRWYDPQGGCITLDGVDLREYNVQWLRERMGLVLQDPVLFQASVAENIALGLPEVASGAQTGADGGSAAVGAEALRALQPRIEAAARAANAHDFILRDLADGYATYVGEKGGQMSGGQRQRVCIARALIRSPAIMLLDEATSALDTRSERIVQAAIDRLLSGEADAELARSGGAAAAAGLRASRTSVCIAHRLSTIRGATSIVVMEGGSITAQGTHAQLMGVEGGLYRTMVEQQALGSGGGHGGARKRRAGSAASGARASATGAGIGSGLAAAAAASADESGEESADEEGEGEVEGGEAAPASSLAPAGDHTAIAVKGTDPEAIARAVSARSAASARSRTHTHASIGSPEGSGVAPEVNMLASVMAVPLPVRRPSTVGGPAAGEGDGEAGEVAMVTSTNANPLFAYTTPSAHPADGAAAPAADGDAIQHRGSSAVRRGASSAQRKAAAAAAAEAPAPAAAADAGGKGKGKDGKDKKAAEPDLPAVPFKRVFAYQRPELWHMLLATLSAGVAGAAMPSFSILFSRMTNVFYSSTADIQNNTAAYCGYFILIGVVCFFGQLGMWGLFAYAGEKLTRRLRVATYKAVLTQEVAYFDDQANTTGRITARLSEEAALVKATTGEKLALATQSICSLITGLVIAFVASWRVALLVLAVFPLIALVGATQVKLLAGMSAVKESEEAGNIVLEATSSIRTVYAFGLQNLLLARFAAALRPMEEKGYRRSWMTGAGMGAAMAVLFGSYALVFWAGGRFVNNGWLSFQDMLQAFFAIVMAAQGAGQASGLATDAGKAEKAKRSIFALLDRRSAINPLSEGGERPSRIAGTVEFRDVGFAYPARPGQPVLRGLNVTVRAGQTLALVGPSGSGKSTLIALLQRWYDPASGSVLLDGRDIREYPPHFLRGVQALVPQMPALWGDAVEYNIAYGRLPHTIPEPDAGVAVDAGPGAIVPATFKHDPTVEASARSANAHDFIAGFPHGYATHVGAGGSGLSGGQRSRVAIARAIHRNPRIVLLDEATAALDSESERIVQAALDNLLSIAGSGRPGSGPAGEDEEASSAMTKIVVAHRLATIRHADIIAVVNDGRVVEQGTHAELMQRGGGLYRQLALAQDPSAAEGYAIAAAAAPAPAATA